MQLQPPGSLSVQPNLLTGKQHSHMLMTPNLVNQHNANEISNESIKKHLMQLVQEQIYHYRYLWNQDYEKYNEVGAAGVEMSHEVEDGGGVKPGDTSTQRHGFQRESSIHNLKLLSSQEFRPRDLFLEQSSLNLQKFGMASMPLGSDNFYIPIDSGNIGAIISFVLGSNIYKEAMIKSNYMESQAKIKVPTKHIPRGNVTETPNLGGGGESLRQSVVGAAVSMNTSTNMNMGSNQQLSAEDTVKLYGKEDFFNYEMS
jgi:hypothetical protein